MTAHAHDEFQLPPPSTGFGNQLNEEIAHLGDRIIGRAAYSAAK